MDNLSILKNLGLKEHEAQVYIMLLRIGGSVASKIAKEAGIKRTSVYALLKELAEKGFALVYYRKGKRFYYPQPPARLGGLLEKKVESFKNLIPVLSSLNKKQTSSLGLRFVETKQELEDFYRDALVRYKNKSYYIISSAPGWEGLDPEFFIQFRKDRGRANIRTKLLLSAESEKINPTDPALKREWRYLPPKYNFRSTIDIYPDQILIVSEQLSSLAVVIAIPAMVDVFKSIFELLWDLLDSDK